MKDSKFVTRTGEVKFETVGELGNRLIRISNLDINEEIISQTEIPFIVMHHFVTEYINRVLIKTSYIEL